MYTLMHTRSHLYIKAVQTLLTQSRMVFSLSLQQDEEEQRNKYKYANLLKIQQISWIQSWIGAAGVITCLCACQCVRAVLFQINGSVNLWESMIMHAAFPGFNHERLHSALACTYIYGPVAVYAVYFQYIENALPNLCWWEQNVKLLIQKCNIIV